MRTRILLALTLLVGLVSCNKKNDPYEVINKLTSNTVVMTETHWSPLHNGDTIRLSIEENTETLRYDSDSIDIDTSWFAKIFIDSTMIAHTEELPWQGIYVVDLEAGNHELFATGRIKMKEFSLHGISIAVEE